VQHLHLESTLSLTVLCVAGISREVVALHGDRPPPVAIVDSSKVYRKRFKRDFKPSPWEHVGFDNPARADGLLLKHWRKKPTQPTDAPTSEPNGDAMEVDNEPKPQPSAEYEFAKYNVQITVPSFTDEQYEQYLVDRTGDWSREETEYLLELIRDYYQKWPAIYDRYEWRPAAPTMSVEEGEQIGGGATLIPKDRTMEEMKARYYFICAKAMEFSLPNGVADMNTEEFALHDAYTKFNPELERRRKQLAWALCLRDEKDIKEEEWLLSELQRIMISAQKYETERAELRSRLEHAPSQPGATSLPTPLSSAALNSLYNQLQAQDRNRKPRARISIDAMQSPANVAGGLATPASAGGNRDSLSASANKRMSLNPQTPIRALAPRDEARFGITTHERLTSGVTFRTDKILKLRQAKSNIQTQKIHTYLTQLEIPELLPLPTNRVVQAYELLIQKINILLDARKVLAKEEAELQTAVNIKAEISKQKANESGADSSRDAEGEIDADGEEDAEGEEDDDDAEGEELDEEEPEPEPEPEPPRPSSSRSNAALKRSTRSASILSAASSKASRRKR
jgi:DNA methyltransferase 1-associated protein 1